MLCRNLSYFSNASTIISLLVISFSVRVADVLDSTLIRRDIQLFREKYYIVLSRSLLVYLCKKHYQQRSFVFHFQIEAGFSNALATFRFDSLFDYGNELQDIKAVNLVNRYYSYLNLVVQPRMQEKNQKRKEKGQLTYPYFIPRWLPNGIQTQYVAHVLWAHVLWVVTFLCVFHQRRTNQKM